MNQNAGAAANGTTHAVGATAGGISLTAMPKRVGMPFNPASNRPSHAPPNALTTTIQEAKLALAQAAAQVEIRGEGGEGTHRVNLWCSIVAFFKVVPVS
jgi:hypothetical protein